MTSGAYLTRGHYGGLVRGCRACKMPLAADLSCPRCGPRATPGTTGWRRAQRPDYDLACKQCGYYVHAKTCPTLEPETPEGWTRASANSWRHKATCCSVWTSAVGDAVLYAWCLNDGLPCASPCATLAEACDAVLKAHAARQAQIRQTPAMVMKQGYAALAEPTTRSGEPSLYDPVHGMFAKWLLAPRHRP